MKKNKIILTIDLFFAIVLLLTFAFQDNIKNYMIQKRFQNNNLMNNFRLLHRLKQ